MTVVYTIGYEGTDIDRFVSTLKAVGVKKVADVRAVALSRKKGFSKKALSARLKAEGIEYSHFIELGDPKAGREAARLRLYLEFRDIYEKYLDSDKAQLSFHHLSAAVREAPTCLLCFEREPATCHRSIIAEQLAESGIEVFDLYGDNPERYVLDASKLTRHHPGQSATAA